MNTAIFSKKSIGESVVLKKKSLDMLPGKSPSKLYEY